MGDAVGIPSPWKREGEECKPTPLPQGMQMTWESRRKGLPLG